MDDRPDRGVAAVQPPIDSGGMGASFGVAAPIGAVSRRSRRLAGRTSLRLEGSSCLLLTALPGTVSLQRRRVDGSWETLRSRRASRLGRTRLELPPAAGASPQPLRVVFSPRNPNLTSWISEHLAG
jgi:hypothetical protein